LTQKSERESGIAGREGGKGSGTQKQTSTQTDQNITKEDEHNFIKRARFE